MDKTPVAMELNDEAVVGKLSDLEKEQEASQETKSEAKQDQEKNKTDGKDAKKDTKKDVKKPVPKKDGKTSEESADDAQTRIAEGRTKALNDALAHIEKQFGKGAVMRWGEKTSGITVDVVPTGCLGLDIALGIGGIPRGRIIEIYGPESSGKTTVTLHIVAEVQKMKGIAAFIDAEHALDPVYAKKLGVNIDDLYISQPDNGEQALDIAEDMVRSGAIDLVVIDSVAALVPKAEIEGEMGQSHMGVHARLMSQALRKLTAIANKTGTIVIFTNQLRTNIGGYGSPETTTGGRALKFYASIRLDIRRDGDPIKVGDKLIGSHTRIKVAKNKLAPPFKTCTFDIMYGEGISYEGDVLDVGVAADVVYKGGSWYSYNETRLGQGREPAKATLRSNPDICVEIENAVRAKNDMKTLTEIRNAPLKEIVTIDVKPSKTKKGKSDKTDKAKQTESFEDDFYDSSGDGAEDTSDDSSYETDAD